MEHFTDKYPKINRIKIYYFPSKSLEQYFVFIFMVFLKFKLAKTSCVPSEKN